MYSLTVLSDFFDLIQYFSSVKRTKIVPQVARSDLKVVREEKNDVV